jgi:hypothetical protein
MLLLLLLLILLRREKALLQGMHNHQIPRNLFPMKTTELKINITKQSKQ